MDSRLPGYETQRCNTSINIEKIIKFIDPIETATKDIFQRDFKCDFFAEIYISSVTPKFRMRGLATEMYVRTIPYLRGKGFSVLRSIFTSAGTQTIGSKLGFTELGRSYFKDGVDENGVKLFPNAGEHEFANEIAYIL